AFSRSSSLLEIEEIEQGLNFVAVSQAEPLLFRPDEIAVVVAPSALLDKEVPDKDLFIVRLAAIVIAPLQNLLVGFSFRNEACNIVVADPEKTAAAPVESGSEKRMILFRQIPRLHQTSLAAHTRKIDKPFGFLVAAD